MSRFPAAVGPRILIIASSFFWGGCAATSPAPKPLKIQTAATETVSLDAEIYKLASGDTVRVDVLGEPELSIAALIDPAGFVNYPFLGRIQAANLTVRQLEKNIFEGLKSGYLVNPDVRVSIASYRPVYVSGQVRQAGVYAYSVGLTVDKVLTMAGGITQYGSVRGIYLQRAGYANNQRINVGLDGAVFPGDTVVVEERLF